MTMLGYTSKILRIDLTNKTSSVEPLNMDWAEKYIGSKGLAIKYLYEELEPGIDPLGPDNKLLFTTGPMTGTPVPCSGKLSIAAKSPATGTINDCSIGGHSAIKIKYAGYDMVIFEGALDKPGYVMIDDDKVTFEDADELWGKGSHETEKSLPTSTALSSAIFPLDLQGKTWFPCPASTPTTIVRQVEAVSVPLWEARR